MGPAPTTSTSASNSVILVRPIEGVKIKCHPTSSLIGSSEERLPQQGPERHWNLALSITPRLELPVEHPSAGHEDKSQNEKYHQQARLVQQHARDAEFAAVEEGVGIEAGIGTVDECPDEIGNRIGEPAKRVVQLQRLLWEPETASRSRTAPA